MTVVILKGTLFAALLVYAAITDIKRREVDDWLWVSILIVSLLGSGGSFWGAVITALPFFIPAFFKSGSVGGGDIKLIFACGAVLGVWGGMLQTVIALTLAALFSLGAILRKRAGTTAIPLAPFLCAGGIASYIITNIGGILP
jgi:leader peptidase (prepilin peptidase)/N-methyltransferase